MAWKWVQELVGVKRVSDPGSQTGVPTEKVGPHPPHNLPYVLQIRRNPYYVNSGGFYSSPWNVSTGNPQSLYEHGVEYREVGEYVLTKVRRGRLVDMSVELPPDGGGGVA